MKRLLKINSRNDAQCTRSGPKIDRHGKPNLRVSVEDITLFTHFER